MGKFGYMQIRAHELRYSIPDLLALIHRDVAAADTERAASIDGIAIRFDRNEIESEGSRMSDRESSRRKVRRDFIGGRPELIHSSLG